ncbi:MAG: anthranilate phosphoribosyltransferase, partial [Candidatus Omnitrophica bacterium]|nr:anthranilate phosphoribosyltransferase [Candidatus Omnitrophota bacterium]
TGKTKVSELKGGRIRNYYITPEKFGIKRASLEDIKGGDAKENAGIVISVLKGERSPRRDVVLLNAAASLISAFRAKDMEVGIKLAAESIDSGRAMEKMLKLIELTNG